MAKTKTEILHVNIRTKDGWLTAYFDIDGRENEICRMVSPPHEAYLRAAMMDAFQTLAAKILESIVRDDFPDAEFSSKVVYVAKEGHG